MKYTLKPYVRCCMYNDQIVFLNLKTDRYIFLNMEDSIFVKELLENVENEQELPDNNLIESLETLDLIELSNSSNSNIIINKTYSSGASNLDWVICESSIKSKVSIFEVLNAYFVLTSVYARLYIFGFYSVIKKLGFYKRTFVKVKNNDLIQKKVIALNQAAFYFPKRVKCLEWSIALCLILLKKGQLVNLQIGIQNFPFASHAWVKVEDEIIADDQNLSKNLAIILNEPFIL